MVERQEQHHETDAGMTYTDEMRFDDEQRVGPAAGEAATAAVVGETVREIEVGPNYFWGPRIAPELQPGERIVTVVRAVAPTA